MVYKWYTNSILQYVKGILQDVIGCQKIYHDMQMVYYSMQMVYYSIPVKLEKNTLRLVILKTKTLRVRWGKEC